MCGFVKSRKGELAEGGSVRDMLRATNLARNGYRLVFYSHSLSCAIMGMFIIYAVF